MLGKPPPLTTRLLSFHREIMILSQSGKVDLSNTTSEVLKKRAERFGADAGADEVGRVACALLINPDVQVDVKKSKRAERFAS